MGILDMGGNRGMKIVHLLLITDTTVVLELELRTSVVTLSV